MPITRFNAEKDNTITNAYSSGLRSRATGSNMGSSDSLEIFSIYGQATTSSLEKSRILIQFPTKNISNSRTLNKIPKSGSVRFYLKLFNAVHPSTTPERYHICVSPLLQEWTEGIGLDMETYKDKDVSNWTQSQKNINWNKSGSSYADQSILSSNAIPTERTQYFEKGTENLELEITDYVEEWIKDYAGLSTAAQGSIELLEVPDLETTITLRTTSGASKTLLVTSSAGVVGSTTKIERSADLPTMQSRIVSAIDALTDFSSNKVSNTIHITQSSKGYFGNTIISSSLSETGSNVTNFSNGSGIINNGLVVKLSGSAEDGTNTRSYYTKKFFSRGTEFFFYKPVIESQWDNSISDDRGSIFKSSSLVSSADNINNLYLYNRIRGSLVDIPNTGSHLVVQLYTSSAGGAPSLSERAERSAPHASASTPSSSAASNADSSASSRSPHAISDGSAAGAGQSSHAPSRQYVTVPSDSTRAACSVQTGPSSACAAIKAGSAAASSRWSCTSTPGFCERR